MSETEKLPNESGSGHLPLDKIYIDIDSEFVYYSDFNIDLDEHPYTQDVKVPTNAASIKQAIKNLFLTKYYSRLWHPEIGSFFSQVLFSPADAITVQQAKNEVYRLFSKEEPRITVRSVEITNIQDDPSALKLVMKYTINLTGYDDEFEYTISRTR